MEYLFSTVLIVHVLAAIGVVGLVLVQQGKGADMSASFGGGASGSLFDATGSANFLSRSTAIAATVFFLCTLALAYFGNLRPQDSGSSILDRAAAPVAASAPASAAPAAAQIPGLVAPAASVPASR